MEVDSVHAKVETRDLETPAGYCRIIRDARQKPCPFTCKYLEYDFFKNFEVTQGYDPCVVDVKEFQCCSDGEIKYKLSHETGKDYDLLPRAHRQKKKFKRSRAPPLYTSPLPITAKKFKDLQHIELVLHPIYHKYYDDLLHL